MMETNLLRSRFHTLTWLIAIVWASWTQILSAQEEISFDIETWLNFSSRAERVVTNQAASDEAFLNLQSQLVVWKNAAQSQLQPTQAEIARITGRIEALAGSNQEEEEQSRLNRLLDELNGNLSDAEIRLGLITDVQQVTNGLIDEINNILATRSRDRLYSIGPSPLNPAHWQETVLFFGSFFSNVFVDLSHSLGSQAQRTQAWQNIGVTLLFLASSIFIMFFGRQVVNKTILPLLDQNAPRTKPLLESFISVFNTLILPLASLYLFYWAIISTGFIYSQSLILVDALLSLGVVVLSVNWLAREVYHLIVSNSAEQKPQVWQRQIFNMSLIIGWILGLDVFFNEFVNYQGSLPQVDVILSYIVILLGGIFLFRVARILSTNIPKLPNKDDKRSPLGILISLLARVSIIVSVLAIGFGTAGFTVGANTILMATLATLLVIAGYWFAMNVFIKFYFAICQITESEILRSWSGPFIIVIGLINTMLFAILLLYSWGYSYEEIALFWNSAIQGVEVGGQLISLEVVWVFLLVIVVGYLLTRISRVILNQYVLPYTKMDLGLQSSTLKIVSYIGLGITLVVAVSLAGIDLTNLAIVIGALSVGIGFGLQEVVSNFISGLILLFERPVKEGDWIEVGSTSGTVRKISVRSTTIETFDRAEVVVPNKDLMAQAVKNWTLGTRIGRIIIPVGVAYGSDVGQVQEILLQIAKEHPAVADDPAPSVAFMRFGADALEFDIRAILTDVNFMISARSEINFNIAKRFEEEGIEIPFSQRDIWLRNDHINIRTMS
ncbi:MAG: mechanosensitive ion channel family protein [Rhodobacteraceae bacterium]|nr:mechanosensitive ion channel family protein [Paracoccaceae bacterium]MYF46217.1 mechanosensitive ion channel family protein [Paracoccaceae bacterium]MYI90622.1 mechanosensitive ion channel family protein [Paracoccaceae bacterium]